jgi:hypothetical protein
VNELIEKANQQWDERNAEAIAEGGEELPSMLPLIRLKVSIINFVMKRLFVFIITE